MSHISSLNLATQNRLGLNNTTISDTTDLLIHVKDRVAVDFKLPEKQTTSTQTAAKDLETMARIAQSSHLAVGLEKAQMVKPDERIDQVIPGKEAHQIEVGGPFVGIEMHHGTIEPCRISLFHPVANSIDVAGDYWNRGNFPVLTFNLQTDGGKRDPIGKEQYDAVVNPYSVRYTRKDGEKRIKVSYEFCKDKPAMVMKMDITNISGKEHDFTLDTGLDTTFRTSAIYNTADKPAVTYDTDRQTAFADYSDPRTQQASLFVANTGEVPSAFTGRNQENGNPVTSFTYTKHLKPGETLSITQIIGSCRQGEKTTIVDDLKKNYQKEVDAYEQHILNKMNNEGRFTTGDPAIDETARWAKAILSVNAHNFDGTILPMPCPAEYNFFFTHDTLVTDLAAVNFDPARVKRDLLYIAGNAKDNVIPHSRYWSDDHYKTEYAGADNWNHFWFTSVSARYLRHTGDQETVEKLYPIARKSMETTLLNMKDGLINANRPDWWDLGDSYGPRSYMTILAIHSLKELAYMGTSLGEDPAEIKKYEDTAAQLQENLGKKLWDKDQQYLVNYYKDGTKDPHYYIGSLLANHYDVIDDTKKEALVATAKEQLLEEKTGIYNATPMDFHNLIDYLHCSGNEAGAPYYYMNGGIWYQGNAWYALALTAAGKKDEAHQFLKDIMTIDGIKKGPNGQPALYECRNGNPNDPENYGKVDKPEFLWAGSWYLYTLYNLLGQRENEWNMSFEPYLPKGQEKASYELTLNGKPVPVNLSGAGNYIREIKYDGVPQPTAVIQEGKEPGKSVDIILGQPTTPYLASTNSIVNETKLDEGSGTLKVSLKAFPGHANQTKFISPENVKTVKLNGKKLNDGVEVRKKDDVFEVTVRFAQQKATDTLEFLTR